MSRRSGAAARRRVGARLRAAPTSTLAADAEQPNAEVDEGAELEGAGLDDDAAPEVPTVPAEFPTAPPEEAELPAPAPRAPLMESPPIPETASARGGETAAGAENVEAPASDSGPFPAPALAVLAGGSAGTEPDADGRHDNDPSEQPAAQATSVEAAEQPDQADDSDDVEDHGPPDVPPAGAMATPWYLPAGRRLETAGPSGIKTVSKTSGDTPEPPTLGPSAETGRDQSDQPAAPSAEDQAAPATAGTESEAENGSAAAPEAAGGNGSAAVLAPPEPPLAPPPTPPQTNGSSPRSRRGRAAGAGRDLSQPLGERPANQSKSTWNKEAVIELREVHKAFGQFKVLDGVSCRIPKGEITVLMGPSGTGKSVTLRHIVGLLPPDKGDVYVANQDVPKLNDNQLLALRRGIGMLFQDGALFSSMNLFDNVAFPLRQHTRKSEKEIREIVIDRLTEVGLAGAEKRMPNELSGGMRKRAGFARALVMEPDILLFDEPDSGLDPVRTTLLCDLIREISAKYHATSIVVSHDVGAVRRFADNIGILYKGKMRHFGSKQEIEESQDEFVHQFFNASSEGPLGMD